MKPEFQPALDAFLADLRDLEQKVSETKRSINRLCEMSQDPPMFADTAAAAVAASSVSMRADQFYGKVLTTAAREYLEMRYSTNKGPAAPRDIYDALQQGGFKFDTKIEANAITGVRATLRKNSSIFHRLPNGLYGLLAWYPNAKAAKVEDDEDDEPAPKRKPPKAQQGQKKEQPQPKPKNTGADQKEPIDTAWILTTMADGGNWTPDGLRAKALEENVAGVTSETSNRSFHAVLMGLHNRGQVERVEKGVWRITKSDATTREELGV